jgi:hypothetical protein
MKHRLAILIPYFGPWPAWINFFVESCRWNRDVDWFLFSDNEPPENRSRNVRHVRLSFAHYNSLVSEALEISFRPRDPYKLCDIRPALPFVHRPLLVDYDFIGFGDLDVIYGDLRSFYDNTTLSTYDLLSTHADRISGHLCLMRNEDRMITAFMQIPGWRKLFKQEQHAGTDEREFYNIFRGRGTKIARWLGRDRPRCLLREAYSTPGARSDIRWYWKDGKLTNEFYPHHPFMYLHFMNWHSNRWCDAQARCSPDGPAPWSELSQIAQMDWKAARKDGFSISPAGILPLDQAVR